MADTAFNTSTPSDQAVQLWLDDVYREREIRSFWTPFMDKSGNNAIHVKDTFVNQAGYQLKYDIMEEPTSTVDGPSVGAVNGGPLWDNEEAMLFDQETVDIFEMRNGVRFTQYSQQLTVHPLLKYAESFMKEWSVMAQDKMIFNVLAGEKFRVTSTDLIAAAVNTNVIYGGTAESEATINETHIFDTSCIDRAKEAAITGDMDGSTIWRIRPIMVDGAKHYICVIDPFQEFDLREDTKWIEAQKHANWRGSKNPIFNGTLGVWNNVILYSHNYIRKHSDWGPDSNVAGATALFLGAQAGCFAKAQVDGWDVGFQEFDYTYKKSGGYKRGVSIKHFGGFIKTQFTPDGGSATDFGVIAIKTAAKSHTIQTS